MIEGRLFADVLREWIRLKAYGIKPSTAYGYRLTIENRIIPAIGQLHVDEITTDILRNYLYNLNIISIRKYRQIICPALDMAKRHGLIQYNPCEDLPTQRQQRTPVRIYTLDEVRCLIDVATPKWRKDVIELIFRTGLRTGEIFALQWNAVDLRNGRIIVQASNMYAPQYGIQTEMPKTPNSIRCVDIDKRCIKILSSIPRTSKYVFAKDDGTLRHGTTMQMFRLCEKAGIPKRNLRHMRNTHVSMLVAAGVPLPEIQHRVGHASPETLLRYYTQFAVGTQKETIKFLNEIELNQNKGAA